jgi:hypothetical protein
MSADENERIGKTLDKVQQGHAASMTLGFLGETLEEENGAIDREAFRMLKEKTLTPEIALSLWQRRAAMKALVDRLKSTIEVGRRSQYQHPAATPTPK